ncbi:MAG: TRAP transporter substrate-binding protein DctP [Bryobacterales bacterium]|nr:TRAP transporter substrate-binding protein DctP [Bryobacterales bacterium]
MRRLRVLVPALLAATLLVTIAIDSAAPQRRRVNKLRLGTIAPKNSIYHEALLRLRQQWREISGGTVELAIYPGGVAGDEITMLRKMRAGQMQAALISGSGMSFLDEGISALQVPMMFRSIDEFDFVRSKMAPTLESRLADKGYSVLGWGDAGRAYFFSVNEFRTPEDVRQMKLYTSKGDEEMLKLYDEFGFRAVPLDLTELQANLETGLVEVFAVPPLLAAGYQWFGSAPNMLDLPFVSIVGALLISTEVWNGIPPDLQVDLQQAATSVAAEIETAVRAQEEKAITEMQRYGLNVIEADEDLVSQWSREMEAAYPDIRDRYAPGELMDAAMRWRDAFRSR